MVLSHQFRRWHVPADSPERAFLSSDLRVKMFNRYFYNATNNTIVFCIFSVNFDQISQQADPCQFKKA